ncbi:MAG: polyisoprenoid-binding protein [Lysobacteraceae bacterium]|nr:MAG: polyisoprenoid-binding protein [Xanthomonadaceae bacterium]
MPHKTVLAALVLAAAWAPAHAETYVIDPNHTQVRFTFSHFGLSNITGLFTGITGSISYDPARPEASRVEATIPVAQVHTGVEKLDQHLRSADFFDVERFPEARFTSTAVKPMGEGRLRVTGELAVRDLRREVVLDVHLNAAKEHPMSKRPAIGFDARTRLRRTELGVGKYAPAVSDELPIEITVEASVPAQAGSGG